MYDKAMIRYSEKDIPEFLSDHDKDLIRKANDQRWEDIEVEEAESEKARQILYDIALSKYRREEYHSGMA